MERLRALIGELLGGDADELALVPATSYGFAVAANILRPRPGGRVLVLAEEYPSGTYTWRRLAGQRVFEITPMAIAATEQILAWGVDDIATTLATVTDTIADRARPLGLVPSAERRGPHLLGLTLPESVRDNVVAALARARCFAAVRGSMLRISPHLHVTGSDVDRLIDALGAAVVG